jgi:hypothetical protein
LKPGTTVDNAHVVEFIESTTPWAVGYLWTGDVNLANSQLQCPEKLSGLGLPCLCSRAK